MSSQMPVSLLLAACMPAYLSAGQWRAFTGNEIGAMLAEWVLRRYRQRQAQQGQQGQPTSGSSSKLAVLSSTVSSRMLAAIAEKEGIHWVETLTGKQLVPAGGGAGSAASGSTALTLCPLLYRAAPSAAAACFSDMAHLLPLCCTIMCCAAVLLCCSMPCCAGFKWLGNEALKLEAQGYTVLFAYEEAIGFMMGQIEHDKDGISAAVVFAELAGVPTCLRGVGQQPGSNSAALVSWVQQHQLAALLESPPGPA